MLLINQISAHYCSQIVGNIEKLVRSYRNVYQALSELMMSNQGIRSQTLYRSINVQHVYHHAKFEFSGFSSLANMKGDGGRGASTK